MRFVRWLISHWPFTKKLPMEKDKTYRCPLCGITITAPINKFGIAVKFHMERDHGKTPSDM